MDKNLRKVIARKREEIAHNSENFEEEKEARIHRAKGLAVKLKRFFDELNLEPGVENEIELSLNEQGDVYIGKWGENDKEFSLEPDIFVFDKEVNEILNAAGYDIGYSDEGERVLLSFKKRSA